MSPNDLKNRIYIDILSWEVSKIDSGDLLDSLRFRLRHLAPNSNRNVRVRMENNKIFENKGFYFLKLRMYLLFSLI